MTSPQPPPIRPCAAPSDRLDSWKEIASYLRRDIRTARRWEASEGLPVHRHAHGQHCSVYAFKSEIDVWLNRRCPGSARSASQPTWRRRAALLAAATAVAAVSGAATLVWTGSSLGPEPGPDAPVSVGAVQIHSASTNDRQAFRSYQKGRRILDRRSGARRALPYLAEAVARDGNFAPAHASLAEANIRIAFRAPLQQRTHSFEIAEASVRRALVLEPTLPAAHAMQGWVYLFRDWDWQRARVELETAVRLDPHDANARSYYATYLRAVGRTADAITERRLARETDPLRVELTSLLGGEYLFARRYQDAAREFRNALELEPGYLHALDGLADALGRLGATEARAAQIRLLAARGDLASANTFADRYRRGGLPPAMGWLDRVLLDTYRRSPNATPWDLAYMHARMGHVDAAFAHLEDAFRQRDSGLLQLRTDPDLDPIRSDPRFDQLVRRLGMSE